VTYADNRATQEDYCFWRKGFQNNELDNQQNVFKIKLRFDRAQLLGYATHAHFVLEERMAESPEKVNTFSKDLLEKAKPAALKEFADLTAFAKKKLDRATREMGRSLLL
jgi:peptidyl-dipeptidase Dcp